MEDLKNMVQEAFTEDTPCEAIHRKCGKKGEFYVTSVCPHCDAKECVLVCGEMAQWVMDHCYSDHEIRCSFCFSTTPVEELLRSVDSKYAVL